MYIQNNSLLELQKIHHITSGPRTQLESQKDCFQGGKAAEQESAVTSACPSPVNGFANTPSLHMGTPLCVAPSR